MSSTPAETAAAGKAKATTGDITAFLSQGNSLFQKSQARHEEKRTASAADLFVGPTAPQAAADAAITAGAAEEVA